MIETRRGLDGFPENLAAWCREVGERAPGYARIVEEVLALLERGDPTLLGTAWADRSFDASYDRPLLLFAALRDDALRDGRGHPLWSSIGSEGSDPTSVTRAHVRAALASDRRDLARSLRDRSVQTNETSRSVTWLWPAHILGADSGARPLALVDVGASAGLNLLADRMPPIWKEESGAALPVARDLDVRRRVGFDRNPLDALDPDTARWLEACIWAGEHERIARLRDGIAALRAAREAGDAPELVRADARDIADRVAAIAAVLAPDVLLLAYQTVTIEYFPPAERAAYAAGMEALVAARPRSVWLELERDRTGDRGHPASIHATFRGTSGSADRVLLARCGYHPRSLRVESDGVRRFLEALS